ncbi:D-alanyl-D-alanine carboxypeptidase [Janibacter hoylei]|uniref:D-alanyl-D-alanine carboxypeptidase n=1 Tax=Janibacter hoylei TaxID=364298 RepID=UPI0022388AF9|nr:D-alanyl-D-alanine carboxypeptidase [Janibacter hoylei]MCW4601277.1 D-alanyl-D-alanine carboxypeptidase [Janibacter hoylei]
MLPPADESAPLPTAAGLRDAIADDVGSSALGPRVGIVVRDAVTGDPVWTKGADRPQTPASTAKLLTAAAVAERTDLSRTMKTTVVADGDDLVLVAAGDTMLARGDGDPTAVEGRAGLADLAEQVADSLGTKGAGPAPFASTRRTPQVSATRRPGTVPTSRPATPRVFR